MNSFTKFFAYLFLILLWNHDLNAQPDSLIIVDGVRGMGNNPGTVKILLNNSSPVAGVQFNITSDPNVLIASDVRLTDRVKSVFNIFEFYVTEDSTVHVLAMSTDSSKVIIPGENEIFEVDFEISPGVPNKSIKQHISELKIVDKSGQYISTIAKDGTFFDPQVTNFREVTQSVGLNQLLEGAFTGARGSAWADYDNDGDQDLLYWGNFTTLMQNNGDGTFTHVGKKSGVRAAISQNLSREVNSAAWGDYDNDGDSDIFIYGSNNALLLENNRDGTFAATSASGIDSLTGGNISWVDFNNDGLLDIHIGNGALFKNNGDKTFRNVTQETGMNIITGMVWVDFDNDGDLDAINDESQLRNDGGIFTDISGSTGLVCCAGGISSWGDYDNDGDLDLYITGGDANTSILYLNNGDATFTDVTAVSGAGVTNSRSSSWADIDNDTDLDLFVTSPSIKDDPYLLLRNNGDGTFTDIHHHANVVIGRWIPGADPGFSAIWTDYNNDGKIDLFVSNETYPDFLFKNLGNGTNNHYLTLKFVGFQSNRSGIGARVTVEAGGITQIREVEGGANPSQNSLPVEFGLGQAEQVDRITIRWPSGLEEWTLAPVAVDQFLTIEEGSLTPVSVDNDLADIPKEFKLFQNYPNPFNPTTKIRYHLPQVGLVKLIIYNLMGQEVKTLVDEIQQPGIYKIDWDSKNQNGLLVGSGLYLVQMSAEDFTTTRKILLLK